MNASELEVVNVVATGELEGSVNLENLYAEGKSQIPVVQYDPIHHQGCYIRFEEDGSLITVYNSGKYIVRAHSIDEVYTQSEMLLEQLDVIGVPEEVKQISFDINNIVAKSELDREIALEALSEDLSRGEATCSESKGRLTYKLDNSNCTVNIFRTGKIIIMGASSLNELKEAWKRLTEELNRLFISSQ